MIKVVYHQNTNSTVISIDTASALTELSRRTWWRRIAAGEVTRAPDVDRGRAMLLWSEVMPHIGVAITPEDQHCILLADADDAAAQDDVGQLFIGSSWPQAWSILMPCNGLVAVTSAVKVSQRTLTWA